MGLVSLLSPIQSKLTGLLGGALALSLVGNVTLGWYATHEAKTAAAETTAVIAVNRAATVHKEIVENRNDNLSKATQDSTSAAIASDLASLRSKGRIVYLPAVATGTKGTDSPGTGAVVPTKPDTTDSVRTVERVLTDQEVRDREVCVINTDLVRGWQKFYQGLLTIQKEESVGTTDGTSNRGGTTGPTDVESPVVSGTGTVRP